MKVTDFLEEHGVQYRSMYHRPAFTAQHVAAEEHEPGRYVAKPVVVKVDGKFMMCVLPACCKIDFDALRQQLGAQSVELAEENEIAQIFSDCSLGAEPPFGNLYDMPTIIDKSLTEDDHLIFQSGTHENAIRLNTDDYRRLVRPKVLEFSYQMR